MSKTIKTTKQNNIRILSKFKVNKQLKHKVYIRVVLKFIVKDSF